MLPWGAEDWLRAVVLLIPTAVVSFLVGASTENVSIHDDCVKAGAFTAAGAHGQSSKGFSCAVIPPTPQRVPAP